MTYATLESKLLANMPAFSGETLMTFENTAVSDATMVVLLSGQDKVLEDFLGQAGMDGADETELKEVETATDGYALSMKITSSSPTDSDTHMGCVGVPEMYYMCAGEAFDADAMTFTSSSPESSLWVKGEEDEPSKTVATGGTAVTGTYAGIKYKQACDAANASGTVTVQCTLLQTKFDDVTEKMPRFDP